MEAGEHPNIPTPVLFAMTLIVWIFNKFFLIDLQTDPTMTTTIVLYIGYFVEAATFILVLIRLYENRLYAVKIWKRIVKIWNYLISLRP